MQRWLVAVVTMLGIVGCLIEHAHATDLTDKRPQPTSERNWQIGVTPSYSSGNFGTTTTSEFVYLPFSVRRYFRDGDVSLVIPFVSVTSDGTVT
ncbi:MAG: hypothetical protein OEV99_03485, partial [Nitrospira sp.]|nr:hypothetical protein [Nitrospira sp.]